MSHKQIEIIEQLIACKDYHFNTTSDDDRARGHTSCTIVQYPDCGIGIQESLETKLAPYRKSYGQEDCVENSDEYTALFSRGEERYRFSFLAYTPMHLTPLMDVEFRVNVQLIGTSSYSQNGSHFFADGVICWKIGEREPRYGTLHICPEKTHLNHDKPPFGLQIADVQTIIGLTNFSPMGKYSRLLKEGLQFLCAMPNYFLAHSELANLREK